VRYPDRRDAVVAEIVVETFNLGADAIEECVFDATADGPACFDGGSARGVGFTRMKNSGVKLDAPIGKAASRVNQRPIQALEARVSDAAACCAEPIDFL
jgi:hypothetical protein